MFEATTLEPYFPTCKFLNPNINITVSSVLTQVRSNSKYVNWMSLVVEAEYGVLVDVIGGHYDEAGEPLDAKLFTHALKGFPIDIW